MWNRTYIALATSEQPDPDEVGPSYDLARHPSISASRTALAPLLVSKLRDFVPDALRHRSTSETTAPSSTGAKAANDAHERPNNDRPEEF